MIFFSARHVERGEGQYVLLAELLASSLCLGRES